MALHLGPIGRDDPEREQRLKGTAGRIEIRPAERAAHLATRSLACPSCGMPIVLAAPVGWHESIACAFCEATSPTRNFVRECGWPEVDLIARVR